MGVTGPEHSAAVRMWRGRAVWHAAALPALAIGLGCKPSNPLLWGTHVLQQADLYAHLDLNRAPGHSPLRTTFPIATELTLVRAYAAAALLAGSATPRRALMLGMATDLLDGYAARRSASEAARRVA